MIKALLGGAAALCFTGPVFAQVYVQAPQAALIAAAPVVGPPPNGYVLASRSTYNGYVDGYDGGYRQRYGYGPTISVPSKYGYDVTTALAVVGYATIGRGRRYQARPSCCGAQPNAILTKAYVPFLSSRPIRVIYTPQPPAYVISDASYR